MHCALGNAASLALSMRCARPSTKYCTLRLRLLALHFMGRFNVYQKKAWTWRCEHSPPLAARPWVFTMTLGRWLQTALLKTSQHDYRRGGALRVLWFNALSPLNGVVLYCWAC